MPAGAVAVFRSTVRVGVEVNGDMRWWGISSCCPVPVLLPVKRPRSLGELRYGDETVWRTAAHEHVLTNDDPAGVDPEGDGRECDRAERRAGTAG